MGHRGRFLALAVVLAAGCGNGEEAGPPAGTTATGETGAPAACTNEADGYRVEYPAGWHVNDGSVVEPCSYFHPEPFEVPEGTEFFDVAVLAGREPVELDTIAGADRTRTIVLQEERELGGRRAVRIESEATGEGLYDAGTRYYQVAIAVDGETIVLSTFDVGDRDYERNKASSTKWPRASTLSGDTRAAGPDSADPSAAV